MKQFYYTSCLAGESVSGQSGFQVRAVSTPLSANETTTCLRALNYKLDVPPSYSGTFPIKLLYCRGERTGNIALQSVWLGEDPATKRTGNYFAHVLCDLTPKINARTVIEWWKSPSWKTNNDGIVGIDLPTPDIFPAETIFHDGIFDEMRNDPELFAIWEFLLCAWWKRTASTRIFVASEQEKFVKALWAVCRVLPEALWKSLSFSTYEKDAMLSPAVVVALWNPAQPENSVPITCFNGSNFAWNVFSGQKSNIPGVPRYIQYIIRSIKNDNLKDLDKFHSSAPAMVWMRRTSAEMFYELLFHPDTLDVMRLEEISHLPNIGRFIVKDEKRLRLLLENFFTSRLLDMWDDETLKKVYEPFFALDAESLSAFHTQVLALLRTRIEAGDVEFIKTFHQKWLPRLQVFNFTEMDAWQLLNESPASLPKAIYRWIYPLALRYMLKYHEPSQQIEFLSRWCFLDVDAVNEPQINEVLQSNFSDIVKLTLYQKFFERDFAGNDAQISRLYFSWPQWNVRILPRITAELQERFLDYLIPTAGSTLLSAIQAQLLTEKRQFNLDIKGNQELFNIYCMLLSNLQIPITKSVADFALHLPQKNLDAIRDALRRRSDIFQLNQQKALRNLFEDTPLQRSFWERFMFWKR